MEPKAKNKWWQGSWTIPVSLMLHVLVGATYLLSSNFTPAPAEPETVSVEMVEPPKEEPPPKPEEKKAEEPPPPPAPEKPAEPPPPPPPPQMAPVAIRPGPTQLDERDEPGQQDAGGQEQKEPEKQPDVAQPAQTLPDVAEEKPEAAAAADKPTAEQGEIAGAEAPPPPDVATVAVPVPKPESKPAPEPAKAAPDGEEGPNLKPAKKILVGAKRPGAMLRQIMGNLKPKDRVAQLCVAEAMAQIKQERDGRYDGLEPHTGKNYPIAGNLMNAQGAFNVGTQWFPIDYRCEVDIENYIVTDFRYNIGAKLTPDDVKRLKLVVR